MNMRSKIPIKAEDIAYRSIDGEAILVGTVSGKILTLNSTGTKVWEMIDGESTVEEIADDLANDFDISLETAIEDCQDFIGELSKKSFVNMKDV